MKTLKTTLLLFLLIFSISVVAQDASAEEKNLDNGNLKEQFDYMMKESNKYQSFKVVKRVWLEKFWSHVADSLSVVRADLKEANAALQTSTGTVGDKDAEISKLTSDLSAVTLEKDQIDLLGIGMNKEGYKYMMWGIVGALLLILVIIFLQFKRSNRVTKDTKSRYQELTDEFDLFKKKTLEKEQVLKRELQDQLNKGKF